MQFQIALCLPRDAQTVPLVRALAIDAFAHLGVSRPCIDDIALALTEACGNVIRHAATSDQYEVRLEIEDRRCVISVIDTGRGFDVEALSQAMPDPSSPGGRGVALMQALTDGIDFTSRPESGTIVHLVKALDPLPGSPLAGLARNP